MHPVWACSHIKSGRERLGAVVTLFAPKILGTFWQYGTALRQP